jgi:DNA primase
MRFGENFMNEIKSRVRVSDVVAKHVKLKRQGREFSGLSPFTGEKTPSFFVNDEKGFYHCFSSGKHGDAISFLMELEGLTFPEAVECLAEQIGIEMPKSDPAAEQRAARNKNTINWMEHAQDFFQKSLYRNAGQSSRDYLKGRGLTKTAADYFGIGYAPNNFSALKDDLIQKGAKLNTLIEAGLLVQPEDTSRQPWDRFRDRIMFPIHDSRGRLVAFGGRAMDSNSKAKYLNSPETPIFQKGHLLYNYHRAHIAVSSPQSNHRGLIVAEGYMDVIALSRAGFKHAVAPMGTALTESQLMLLWRSGPEPILCFDGDKAGIRAAYRSIERALPLISPTRTLRFAMLPDGEDPDDLIKTKGKTAMQKILDQSIPLVKMLWEREVNLESLNSPEAKAGLKSRIFDSIKEIQNEEVRAQYRTDLLGRFDSEFGRRAKHQSNKFTSSRNPSSALKATMRPNAITSARERRLISAILEWPELLNYLDEVFFGLKFTSAAAIQMQSTLLSYWQLTKSVEKSSLNAHIANQGMELLKSGFSRDRQLITAAMGGIDAELETRTAIWIKEASTLSGFNQSDAGGSETINLMAEAIRNDNTVALKRRMRASKGERD